jgi:hypothetical protein
MANPLNVGKKVTKERDRHKAAERAAWARNPERARKSRFVFK